MPQRNVATNFTFEQQRAEINLLAQDFWTQKGTVDTASTTYLKHDGSNNFTGATLAVPNAFTINSNSGGGTVTIAGNLDVTGTTTTVSSANLEVTDKNILISKGSTTDAQADGAGITIDSATDITWNFVDANDAWVSSIGVEATTHLKAAYGHFTGSTTATTGSGVEVFAPDANTGQIQAYNRGTTAFNELRLKGSSVGVYTGSTNALAGTFNSTGLTMESGKNIAAQTLTSTGDVSLGHGTATARLDVRRGDADGKIAEFHQSTGYGIDIGSSASDAYISSGYNQNFIFKTDPSSGQVERLRITSEGYLKLAGTISGSNNKLGRFLMPSHDSGEEDVMYMQFQQEDTYNQLEFGGGSSSYNAATQILFRTAAVDTVTGVERLRIASDGTISKYHNATDISAAFGGSGQVNGVTALPSMAGTPFVVAKDTGSGRSATFAGNVLHEAAVTVRGYVGIGADSYTGYTFPTPTGIQNNVKLLQIDGGDGAELILGNSLSPNVSTNHVGAIAFKNIDNSNSVAPNYAGIRCNCTDTVGNMNLKFYAGATAFEADTPHMLIDALGEVLIGGRTTKPNDINKLVVTGTSPADSFDSQLYLEGSEDTGAINTGGALGFGGNDGGQWRNWGNIYGMKENGTQNNTDSYLSFHTRANGGNPEERLRITSAGALLINNVNDVAPDGFGSLIQVNSANHTGSIQIGRHTANSNGPILIFNKTRSGTAAPGTAALSRDDMLGGMRFFGADGTDNNCNAGGIQASMDGDASNNSFPGRLEFLTTKGGEAAGSVKMTISENGAIVTPLGSPLSYHATNATYEIYNDDHLIEIADSTSGWHVMKQWTAQKSGQFFIKFQGMIQAGAYYWVGDVYNQTQGKRISQSGTAPSAEALNGLNAFRFADLMDTNETSAGNAVHEWRRHKLKCGNNSGSYVGEVKPGDIIQLRMASSAANGTLVTGAGQNLKCQNFRIYSDTPGKETGGKEFNPTNAAFHAIMGGANQSFTNGDDLTWDSTAFNRGYVTDSNNATVEYGFDVANDCFRVPHTGIYHFYVNFFVNVASSCRVSLEVDGTAYTSGYIWGCNTDEGQATANQGGSQSLYLGKGSVVKITVQSGSITNTYGGHTSWGGFLVG